MPGLHKHEPVSHESMYRVGPRYTICECLREIYHLIVSAENGSGLDPEQVRIRVRTAVAMAKAMNKKLQEYKADWDDQFYDDNPSFRRNQREVVKG